MFCLYPTIHKKLVVHEGWKIRADIDIHLAVGEIIAMKQFMGATGNYVRNPPMLLASWKFYSVCFFTSCIIINFNYSINFQINILEEEEREAAECWYDEERLRMQKKYEQKTYTTLDFNRINVISRNSDVNLYAKN